MDLVCEHVRAFVVVLGMVPTMFYATAYGATSGNVHVMSFATASGNVDVMDCSLETFAIILQ